jgi:hypothetical protein
MYSLKILKVLDNAVRQKHETHKKKHEKQKNFNNNNLRADS